MTDRDRAFEIEIVPEDNLIIERIYGTWTMDTVTEYQAAWKNAARGLSARKERLCLTNLTSSSIQPQNVSEAIIAAIDEPLLASSKVAIVTNSATMNLQAKRVAGKRNAQVFSSEAEALNWLRTDRSS
ncbi:MAG: hypothetical protein AAF291_01050 [Pseudomonadota bacterium]